MRAGIANQLGPGLGKSRFFAMLALTLAGMPVLAEVAEEVELNLAGMGMGLFGGLALFLFGLQQLADSLKAMAGDGLRTVLEKLTRNRVLGATVGAVVTAILNSSSVTTVLVVGFVTAGVMNLSQSIGVIMGANIGSTFTAQIIAFNITQYALGMIAAGFTMLFVGKSDRIREGGGMLMGLGLVFFGMGVMSDAMRPLRDYEPFIELMASMERPVLGLLVGALFTGLVQSSAATMGIAIVLASEGLVSLTSGITLALGANIGTCVTAVLASLGKPTEAIRASTAHILFNVLGVLLWIGFVPVLADFAAAASPAYPELSGQTRMAAEVPRQIANANTLFNIINTVIFLPFAGMLARLVVRLVPEKPESETIIIEPKFLDEQLISTPALAMDLVRKELGRLGEIAGEMLREVRGVFEDPDRLEELARQGARARVLHAAIIDYLGDIRQQAMTNEESSEFVGLLEAGHDLRVIAELVEEDLGALVQRARQDQIRPSDAMREALSSLLREAAGALDRAVKSLCEGDQRAAQEVVARKAVINNTIDQVLAYQISKIGMEDPKRLLVFRIEMELVDELKRVYRLAKRIARTVLPRDLPQPEAA